MAVSQMISWIVLPNGTAGEDNHLRLSIFVAPRLRTDQGHTLEMFPDFLDWPAAIHPDRVSFSLGTDNGVQVSAPVVSAPADSSLWKSLFGPDTPVRPFAFDDFSDRPVVTFPVRQVLSYIKERYQTLATQSPEALPFLIRSEEDTDQRQTVLGELFGELVLLHGEQLRGEREQDLSQRLADSLQRARAQAQARRTSGQRGGPMIQPTSIASSNQPASGFYRSMLFHYRAARAEPVPLPETEDEVRDVYSEQIDFHQMLSALGDYPQLLRRLGLVLDLSVPLDALPETPDEFTFRKVRVLPTWTSLPAGSHTDVTPFTNYVRASVNDLAIFAARPRQGEVSGGFWSPPQAEIDVVQVDVDGAILKTLNLGATLARQIMGSPARAIDAPSRDGVPALRTGGVSLVRTGRAEALNGDFNRALDLNNLFESNPAAPPDLSNEDLIRGYRLDVLDVDTGRWRSLHERIGSYHIPDFAETPLEIEDEGFTQVSVTESAKSPDAPVDPLSELYLHESLLSWDGWSLSAPRPGKSISRDPRAPTEGVPETQPQDVQNKALTDLPLETTFRVRNGTLPRLRFGHRYQLRLRAVDLAGNSPTVDEANKIVESLPDRSRPLFPRERFLSYGRFEPVSPPELVPRVEFSEGESLERMVIRSNFDQNAEVYASAHPQYKARSERHVVAPKVALRMVETHGLLDAAIDAKPDQMPLGDVTAIRQEMYALAQREKGTLSDTSLPTVRFVRTSDDPQSLDGYPIHEEEQLELPYLPDPWASGVVLLDLPGQPDDTPTVVSFGGTAWHQATPFRIVVVEGSATPFWDEAARTLTVSLPPASVATVRLHSAFGGEIDHLGLWHWLIEAAEKGTVSPQQMDEVGRIIKESRHWMVTPSRTVTLVHAVQQPLDEPSLHLETERWADATAAHLRGEVELHAESTAKLDLLAEWEEVRDDPSKDTWERIPSRSHVTEIPTHLERQAIYLSEPEAEDALNLRDERTLTFDTQKCAFIETSLREKLADPLANLTPAERDRIKRNVILAEKIRWHEFGDTRYRRVRYHMTATTRFREYFSPDIGHDTANLIRSGNKVEIDVPSSARPAPPHVRSVLPTFGWRRESGADGTIVSRRTGGGVRVYLERPWFSSGDGELLAVVLKDHLPDRRKRTYEVSTFWGQDPIWFSRPLELPKPVSFKNALRVETQVRMAEFSNEKATAVLFQPDWDSVRRRWYCDLHLDSGGAYYPFVRLALARYQHHSIPDVRLSSVVLADFVQTAPDRTASVIRDAADPNTVHITVSGVTYMASRDFDEVVIPGSSEIRVHLERYREAITDEVLAWVEVDAGESATRLIPEGTSPQSDTTWTGRLVVPPHARADRLRLVIREFEQFNNNRGERMVYADTIEL